MLAKARRPIHCGNVRVAFIVRKRRSDLALQNINTPRGTILISTPEATAVDPVGYHHHAGGLDQVVTILSELADQSDPQTVVAAAQTAPIPWAQRFGYLLEKIGAAEKSIALKHFADNTAAWSFLFLLKLIVKTPAARGPKSCSSTPSWSPN